MTGCKLSYVPEEKGPRRGAVAAETRWTSSAGVCRGMIRKLQWFSVSESPDSGELSRQTEMIAAKMTAEQIARGERLARELMHRA